MKEYRNFRFYAYIELHNGQVRASRNSWHEFGQFMFRLHDGYTKVIQSQRPMELSLAEKNILSARCEIQQNYQCCCTKWYLFNYKIISSESADT